MANLPIVIGENALITSNLKQEDGTTDLLLADIYSIEVSLVQNGDTIKEWSYASLPTPAWEEGFRESGDAQVQIEVQVEHTLQLSTGTASLKWVIKVNDAAFFVSNKQTSITTEEVFDVAES